jgi:secondary thiamine-phosphate synthase enzyme
MMSSHTITLHTQGFNDTHNLTAQVGALVRKAGLTTGLVTVFVPGSTAGITTIEFERGAVEDLKKAIERLAPQSVHYDHDQRWGDGNGFSHVRAALLGPSLTIPVAHGVLQLGTWQQIVLIDFDNRPRDREIVVQMVGDP